MFTQSVEGVWVVAGLDVTDCPLIVISRDAELIVVDNLSTLCRGLKENDADSWVPVQSWALAQRRVGKSVAFIHHGGKSGQQRGTSRKEDVLDTVISLRRPPDYSAEQGCRFELHFEKTRGFHGPDAEPFEARLSGRRTRTSSSIRSPSTTARSSKRFLCLVRAGEAGQEVEIGRASCRVRV